MKKLFLVISMLCAVMFSVAPAMADLVQFDPAGGGPGSYLIEKIKSFDWQEDGVLVVENGGIIAANGATTMFAGPNPFFGLAADGDEVEFGIHGQAYLGFFSRTPANGGNVTPSGYEVTVTFDARETATYEAGADPGLKFTDIAGTFHFYIDTPGDLDLATGTGYDNGTEFLTLTMTGLGAGSSFTFDATDPIDSGGSNTILSRVTMVDDAYLAPDPNNPGTVIAGSKFVTTIQLFGLEELFGLPGGLDVPGIGELAGNGGAAANDGYVIVAGDRIFKADSNSTFTVVPEPATMMLFGIGLLGMGYIGRKRA